jgi:hypothetical protein
MDAAWLSRVKYVIDKAIRVYSRSLTVSIFDVYEYRLG